MDDPAEDEPTGFVPSQHQARALERMRKQNHSKSPTKRRFRRVSVSVGSLGTAMKAMGMSRFVAGSLRAHVTGCFAHLARGSRAVGVSGSN